MNQKQSPKTPPTNVRSKFNFVQAYYETTKISDKELEKSIDNALRQERKVLQLFKSLKKPMTVSEIYLTLDPERNSPKTSYGRAATNLKNLGILELLPIQKKGIYGANEHYYKLVKN